MEADASGSKKDFIAKYLIVKKEAKETIYWLSFIMDTNLLESSSILPYINEANEILLVISKIIENIRRCL
jgi:four helix bundle protein